MGQAIDLDIRYLDNHLMVVYKEPSMLSQADDTGDPDLITLGKQYLKTRFNKPGNVYLGLVHRLDRPASGLMVLARTSKSAARLTAQFKARKVQKRYLAIIEGNLDGEGTWQDYLVKQSGRSRVASKANKDAKEARLAWRALATRDGLTLVDIELFTGRAHQIRLQFSSRGYPLLGDKRYGSKGELDGRNLALHSYRLGIEHPTQREPMDWTAPPPPSWHNYFTDEIRDLLNK